MEFLFLLNNNIVFISFMISIMLLSIVFNAHSILKFKMLKKKISPDYIKLQLWIINLVFTLIAMPYFILKELNVLNLFWCNLFYMISDSIMFVYNNLLILMALDRYFFICTKKNFSSNEMFTAFYSCTFLVASTSLVRMFQESCYVNEMAAIFSNCNQQTVSNIIIKIYNDYFIITVVSINMMLTFLIYIRIIVYVRHKQDKIQNYLPIKLLDFKNDLNKAHPAQINMISEVQCSNVKKGHMKLFKNTKHWTIMTIFIKVTIKFYSHIFYFLNTLFSHYVFIDNGHFLSNENTMGIDSFFDD